MNKKLTARNLSWLALVAGILCLAATAIVILGSQRGAWGFRDAMGMLGWIVRASGIIAVFSAIVFLVATRARQRMPQKFGAAAFVLSLIPLVGILINRASPPAGPPINDIATDTTSPPVFEAVIPLRPEGSNPIEYGGATVAARQKELYPDIQPLVSDLSASNAFNRALAIAQEMGWEIIRQSNTEGIIEAVETTTFFHFRDDIAIRVTGTTTGSIVDIRSRSRVGRSDLGKNAARVREFLERFKG